MPSLRGENRVEEVIRSLNACRADRRKSRPARTLVKVCKRVRNDPLFGDWRFVALERDYTLKLLCSDGFIGFAAVPDWAVSVDKRLVVLARRLAAQRPTQRFKPRTVEYVIRSVTIPPSGILPLGWSETASEQEQVYSASVSPIFLANAFRMIARQWSERLCEQIPRRVEQPKLPFEGKNDAPSKPQMIPSDDDFTLVKPIRIDVPRADTIGAYDSQLEEALTKTSFLGRIEMPDEQYDRLLQQISAAIQDAPDGAARARRLARQYPCAIAYALVHVAAEGYAEGEVWPAIAERLADGDMTNARELRYAIEICQEHHGLAICRVTRGLRYVTQMLFQAGIPDSCISVFADMVNRDYVKSGLVTPRGVRQRFQKVRNRYGREQQYQLPEPILDFLEHGGNWAEQWMVVTAAYLGSAPGVYSELTDMAPARLMKALEEMAPSRDGYPPKQGPIPPKGGQSRIPRKIRPPTLQIRLDIGRRVLGLYIGEHHYAGDFSGQGWLQALLRDAEGHLVDEILLDARRVSGGIEVQAVEVELSTIDGPLKLDIEYSHHPLASYDIPIVSTDESCLVFSGSGRRTNTDMLKNANIWVLLPHDAQILPEAVVKMREPFSDEFGWDLAWLDLQETDSQQLIVQLRELQQVFTVPPELIDEEIEFRGGERAQGAFTRGHPIYMGDLPDMRLQLDEQDRDLLSVFRELRLTIESLDSESRLELDWAEALEYLAEEDGWLDLTSLVEMQDIAPEAAVKLTCTWIDPFGMHRNISVVRIPGFIVDFEEKVWVPQLGKTARCDVIVPLGWEFTLGYGADIVGRFDDVLELEMHSLVAYGWLSYMAVRLPVFIEYPLIQWNYRGGSRAYGWRWRSTRDDIWVEDIEARQLEHLVVMNTSRDVARITLEGGSLRDTQPVIRGEVVLELDLRGLPETVRREGPRVELYLVLHDRHSLELKRVHIATLHSAWVPDEPQGLLVEGEREQQIRLSWDGIGPRRRTIVFLRPAWDVSGLTFRSLIEKDASGCWVDASGARPGPYIMHVFDEEELQWSGSDIDHLIEVQTVAQPLLWVSDGIPQIRELKTEWEGAKLYCTGAVHPIDDHRDWVGIALQNPGEAVLREVTAFLSDEGRFRFYINDADDVAIIGLCSGDGLIYRFIPVGPYLAAQELVTGASVERLLKAKELITEGLTMWIAEKNVRPIQIPPASAQHILDALVRNPQDVDAELILEDPDYLGPVKMVSKQDSETEFEFAFRTMLVECLNPDCPHPPGAISQRKWDTEHYPQCKTFNSHFRRISAQIVVTYDLGAMAARDFTDRQGLPPYVCTLADSSFRPLALDADQMKDSTALCRALARAYIDLFGNLVVKSWNRKESG